MSAAKRKGTAFESAIRDALNSFASRVGVPLKVYRPAQEGFRDTGDLHGVSPFVIQAKSWRDLTSALREGVDGAVAQARNAHEPLGVAVVKRPRRPIGDAYAVMRLEDYARVLIRLREAEDRLDDDALFEHGAVCARLADTPFRES